MNFFRLDLSYTKIAMNNWEERQIQVEHCNHSTQENHTHQVMANPGASTRCNENTNNQMDDLKLCKHRIYSIFMIQQSESYANYSNNFENFLSR